MTTFSRSSTAVTLMELIISTAVVGIIMLGVVSSDFAIRKQSDEAARRAWIYRNVQIIQNSIIHDANQAIGNASDKGIWISGDNPADPSLNDNNPFCFRQDINNTADNFADDKWNCYYTNPTTFVKCTRADADWCGSSGTLTTETLLANVVVRVTPRYYKDQNLFTVDIKVYDSGVIPNVAKIFTATGGSKIFTAGTSPPGQSL